MMLERLGDVRLGRVGHVLDNKRSIFVRDSEVGRARG